MAKAIDYEIDLQERLADKSYAVGYLNEIVLIEDPNLVYLGLSDVIQAQPQIASFFVSAYARYLTSSHIQKIRKKFPSLTDYFENHHEVLDALQI
jgi:hypothetical protein